MLELTTERTQATFEELLEDYDYHRPQRGEYREGTIVRMDGDEVIVDLGLKREGTVPPQDIKRLDEELIEGLQVGDEIPVEGSRCKTADMANGREATARAG